MVVDIPASGGHATVVSLADNTTSLYTSVGGGTIGAGAHAVVAAATHILIDTAESQLSLFATEGDDSLPPGSVRFHVLGFDRSHMLDVPEDCFWGRTPHDLMPTIAATQDVITAIHTADSPGG